MNASEDKTRLYRMDEARAELIANALAECYKELTGKPASDRMIEEFYNAVRFE